MAEAVITAPVALQAESDRPAVSFRLHGLGEREATLFKSFLRLLDHRMPLRWVQRDDQAQVWIVPAGRPVRAPEGTHLLSLGAGDAQARHHVAFPIHADELEQQLGRLGEAVLSRRRPSPSGLVQLLRWPPAALIGEPQRMRLATLMTGRAWEVHRLAERGGVTPAYCQAFLDDLRRAGLLADDPGVAPQRSSTAANAAGQARSQVAPGLLGRIRVRLGLASH